MLFKHIQGRFILLCWTNGEMINAGDVVSYHTKHPKRIGLNLNVFPDYFLYLLEGSLYRVFLGYYKDNISYADMKPSFMFISQIQS